MELSENFLSSVDATRLGNRLFIVGNGFDLAHDLPTGYCHFRNFMYSHGDEPVGYEDIELNKFYVIKQFEKLCQPNNTWNDFETKTIAIIDALSDKTFELMGATYKTHLDIGEEWHRLQSSLSRILSREFGESAVSASSNEIRKLTDSLFNNMIKNAFSWIPCLYLCFQEWVRQICISAISPRFSLHSNDNAISFNYTETLEAVYNIHESVSNPESIVLAACRSETFHK
jgi:hypothetical protein